MQAPLITSLLELRQSNSNALVVSVGDGHADIGDADLLGGLSSLAVKLRESQYEIGMS